jgi:succinyl-CoA synthetase beta subunit/citryl-CoA synthetase large subunit
MGWPFSTHNAREVAGALGLTGRNLLAASNLIQCLYELFYRYDATLAEINPLVRTNAGFVALDAHIELEDEALGRHPDLAPELGILPRPTQARPPTPFEEAAARIDADDHRGVAGRVVEFDGDLGLLIGGGGASLTVFDAMLANGGRPANYCELGGNPSVRKIKELTRLILSRPGVQKLAVIMNVVSNTRVDLVARGVIKGIVELGLDPREVLTVFRVPGAWEAEGAKILRHYGVTFFDRTVSLDEAARVAVEKSRGSDGYPGR